MPCSSDNLAESSDLTIVLHQDKVVVEGSYKANKIYGRVSVNGWQAFMEKNPKLVEGDRLVLILSCGGGMTHLFVDLVDEDEDQ